MRNAKVWTREEIVKLLAAHRTHEAAAAAAGISRSYMSKLIRQLGIEHAKSAPTNSGNAEWQALGR